MIEQAFLYAYLVLAAIMILRHLVVATFGSHIDYSVSICIDDTDDEYLARMPSEVSDEVALTVRSILVDVSGCEPDEVWPETALMDLGLE